MNSKDLLNHLSDVIRTDATTVKTSYFLATHTPFKNLRFDYGNTNEESIVLDEDSFFNNYLLKKFSDHQFYIVQGNNGSGKSHFIRWIKEKLGRFINEKNEAIIFISRSQSTLRGALEQIINSHIFKENKITDFEKLVRANEHLNEGTLKRNIIMQFAIAVEEDLNKFGEIANKFIKVRYQKKIYSFLTDRSIQNYLFKEYGPIERIKSRLASKNTNERLDDIEPRFLPDDFKMDFSKLENMKRHIESRHALNLLEDLVRYPELREDLANYLNNFLEIVVQSCTNLRATDLRNVFNDLRKELKKEGKNLTLLIEDITSFTGIDRALVEVLVTEHHGDSFRESLCRLFSVVGVTNDYYQTSFPDNLKDRVTGRIFIDDAFLNSNDEIAELSGRYLNALYLEENKINNWLKNGGIDDDLPLTSIDENELWASYKMEDGRVLPLYPFNKTALSNIYNSLDVKTPRIFLKAIQSIIQLFINLQPKKQFPPSIREFGLKIKIPTWINPSHEEVLSRLPQDKDRLITFFRLWGDRTVYSELRNGKKTVGGLPEEAFKSFNLPFIDGILVESYSLDDNSSTDNKGIIETGIKNKQNSEEKKNLKEQPNSKEKKSEEKQKATVNRQYESLKEELENWANGDSLRWDFRDDIYKSLLQFIDWDTEGIPHLLRANFKSKHIYIEGQFYKSQGKVLNIERSYETKMALLALSAWRYLGNQSWDFPNALENLMHLYKWMAVKKDTFVNFIYSLYEIPINLEELGFLNTLCQFYVKNISGNNSVNTKDIQRVYHLILNKPEFTYTSDFNSQALRGLLTQLNNRWSTVEEQYNYFIDSYNCFQSETVTITPVKYLDADSIFKNLKRIEGITWDLLKVNNIEEYILPKDTSKPFYGIQILQLIKPLIPKIFVEEKQIISSYLTNFEDYLGNNLNDIQISNLFSSIIEFLNMLKEEHQPYLESDYNELILGNLNASNFLEIYYSLLEMKNCQETIQLIVKIVQNTTGKIIPYITLLLKFDELLENISSRYNNQVKDLEKSSNLSDELFDTIKSDLNEMKYVIDEIYREEKTC